MSKSESDLSEEYYRLAAQLTKLQRAFVFEYIKPGTTQREAYLKAGGKAKTPEAQDASANVMFKNDKVRAFYDHLVKSSAKESILTRQEALSILTNNARVRMTDVATFGLEEVGKDENGDPVMQTVWKMKNSDEIDDAVLSCIKSVTMTKQGPKIELHDQQGAIKQLSALEGWDAPRKTELTGSEGAPIAINSKVDSPEIVAALASLAERLK